MTTPPDPYDQYRPPPIPYGYPPPPPAYEPYTGMAYSDKSKVAAGLLQLLLGFFLGLGGVGRLYAGHVGLGTTQVILSVVGWICFWCGFILLIPLIVFAGLWIWFVVDGIVLLAGRSVDGQGRLLR